MPIPRVNALIWPQDRVSEKSPRHDSVNVFRLVVVLYQLQLVTQTLAI